MSRTVDKTKTARHYAIIVNITDELAKKHTIGALLDMIVTVLSKRGKYIVQMERGEKNHRLHGQCLLRTKQVRCSTLAKDLERCLSMDEGAVQVQPCKKVEALARYCSKTNTRVCGPRSDGFELPPAKVKDPLEGKELYPWQNHCKQVLAEDPDDRKICWYWKHSGNDGKSSFVKHWYLENRGRVMLCGGRSQDIFFAADEKYDTYFVDIPRAQLGMTNFAALESLKNGLIFSPKYESGVKCFNIPHIIVFANAPPPEGVWSEDRYEVHNLEDLNRNAPGASAPPLGDPTRLIDV